MARLALADYALFLTVCTVLLYLRVVGQIIVVLRAPRWLPPMKQWQSGLLPYPVLLFAQIIVLTLMTWICLDFQRGAGRFVEPRWPNAGTIFMWIGRVYFGGMVVRYVIWMWRRPDQRWFGGTIPIIFHSVVAAFVYAFGRYHATVLQ
jgi:hypothetical protein